jgi:hypothetical protein
MENPSFIYLQILYCGLSGHDVGHRTRLSPPVEHPVSHTRTVQFSLMLMLVDAGCLMLCLGAMASSDDSGGPGAS